MASPLKITVSQEQGQVPVTVFHLVGDIDNSSYEELQAQAKSAYQAGSHYLLLDLTKVKYMSSAGLRALHNIFDLLNAGASEETQKKMKRGILDGSYKSPYLKLLNPSRDVKRTLSTSGFDMFLEIHTNAKAAVNSFN
ncbi:MAG TPA: STAS domain-containing protein [Anaerolineae bacterium]|nr:STAS domain-containing protein [Anaerolineae bacterium]MCB9108903.1 STAS domain-containing protein [Anaerolineales bacterium]HRV91693.1 STAS domain-containing protein [Anaerolineae bacterium]